MRPLRRLVPLLFVVLACGTHSSPSSSTPLGPDAGAGCDSTIHAHCVFPSGIGDPDVGPVCVEYSGASQDHSSCIPRLSLIGQYATGPCPRDQYDKSCLLPDSPAADAGTCAAFETVWGHSSDWQKEGIAGFPPCLSP